MSCTKHGGIKIKCYFIAANPDPIFRIRIRFSWGLDPNFFLGVGSEPITTLVHPWLMAMISLLFPISLLISLLPQWWQTNLKKYKNFGEKLTSKNTSNLRNRTLHNRIKLWYKIGNWKLLLRNSLLSRSTLIRPLNWFKNKWI